MASKKAHSRTEKMATFIVRRKTFFFLAYIIAIVFSLFSMAWVDVENDVTVYLAEDTEIRQGLQAMNSNFTVYSTAQVMVKNVTYESAEAISREIMQVDGVSTVTFGNTPEHYKDAAALFQVSFSGTDLSQISQDALHQIRQLLSGHDYYINSTIGSDLNAMLQSEMTTILVVAVIIIIAALLLTSRSYAEVAVLLLTFGIAALLNMGTNFLCGKISFISNSIAVVLQLALAIDYAIILCHRYVDERANKSIEDAVIAALSKAIPEVSASSMTTICGLMALSFMKFTIGLDMAVVLIKSIFLSLLSVFTLMPGLLVLFGPLMDKTMHRKLLPNVNILGKWAVKLRRVLPIGFFVILIGACYLSNLCPFTYSMNDIKTAKMSEDQVAYFEIKDTFGTNNMVALIVPVGDYESESAILKELDACPEVKSTMGIANIEALGGYCLGDGLTPRAFAELANIDYEVSQALYGLYAVQDSHYGDVLMGLDEYAVPLFDMFIFLKDQLEEANISLSGDTGVMMDELFAQLGMAKEQMQSQEYSRMVVYLNLPEEGKETYDFLQRIRDIIGQYYPDDYYVVGNSTSSRDLADSFETDNLLISILSTLFVIIVLLLTFRSVGLPVLLIVVIQGSIWINFSYPVLADQPLYFLGYLIVQAIQMGANIDYAIVISSHYQENKTYMPHKEAIVHAVNSAFPTIFTSGTIMASAGLLIGNMSAQPVVSIMGMCIGRGTIISIILVLLVLPSILVLGDSIIEITSFRIRIAGERKKNMVGTMYVDGHMRGYVCGNVDGTFTGIIRGEMDANIALVTKFADEAESFKQDAHTKEEPMVEEGGAEHG